MLRGAPPRPRGERRWGGGRPAGSLPPRPPASGRGGAWDAGELTQLSLRTVQPRPPPRGGGGGVRVPRAGGRRGARCPPRRRHLAVRLPPPCLALRSARTVRRPRGRALPCPWTPSRRAAARGQPLRPALAAPRSRGSNRPHRWVPPGRQTRPGGYPAPRIGPLQPLRRPPPLVSFRRRPPWGGGGTPTRPVDGSVRLCLGSRGNHPAPPRRRCYTTAGGETMGRLPRRCPEGHRRRGALASAPGRSNKRAAAARPAGPQARRSAVRRRSSGGWEPPFRYGSYWELRSAGRSRGTMTGGPGLAGRSSPFARGGGCPRLLLGSYWDGPPGGALPPW